MQILSSNNSDIPDNTDKLVTVLCVIIWQVKLQSNSRQIPADRSISACKTEIIHHINTDFGIKCKNVTVTPEKSPKLWEIPVRCVQGF